MNTDIIIRNLFRLLRTGAFGESEPIEPMSQWKWGQLYQYGLKHNVLALLNEGTKLCQDQFFLQIPEELQKVWDDSTNVIEAYYSQHADAIIELYEHYSQLQLRPMVMGTMQSSSYYHKPSLRSIQAATFFFPFPTQGTKANEWAIENCNAANDNVNNLLRYDYNNAHIEHCSRIATLTNKFLNHSLQNIIEQEIRENNPTFSHIGNYRVEVPSPNITVLTLLVQMAKNIINDGFTFDLLVDLAIFLRNEGDKVDYVKLQGWIDKLSLKKISLTVGTMLVDFLNFQPVEIPFIEDHQLRDIQRLKDELFSFHTDDAPYLLIQQSSKDILHINNSSDMLWRARRSARYFSYYPSESFTNFLTSVARSLSIIEE